MKAIQTLPEVQYRGRYRARGSNKGLDVALDSLLWMKKIKVAGKNIPAAVGLTQLDLSRNQRPVSPGTATWVSRHVTQSSVSPFPRCINASCEGLRPTLLTSSMERGLSHFVICIYCIIRKIRCEDKERRKNPSYWPKSKNSLTNNY